MSRMLVVVFFLLSLAACKNVAPAGKKREPPERHRANIETQAPSVRVTGEIRQGGSQRSADKPNVDESHVFYQNYAANFSWDDARMRSALGIKESHTSQHQHPEGRSLSKRAPAPHLGEGVYGQPTCLGCIEAAAGNIRSVNDLSTEWLEQQILISDAGLRDKCVFYTSVPGTMPFQFWDRQTLGGAERHPGLSYIATQWACSVGKYTIWDLYSGKNNVRMGPDNVLQRNYWEVFVKGSWLYFLKENEQEFIYFENMSRAMARHCGGVVYVVSMLPQELWKYEFIWGKVEHPTLLARYQGGLGGAPTKLIAVNAAKLDQQFEIDWSSQQVISRLTEDDAHYLRFGASDLEKRDTCTENVDYEPPGDDWFG